MKDIQKQESLKTLKNILTPNDTIYGLVRKVSSSGLSRTMDFYTIKQNKPISVSYHIANILGCRYDSSLNGAKINGMGMDVCLDAVLKLSIQVFGDAKKLKAGYL